MRGVKLLSGDRFWFKFESVSRLKMVSSSTHWLIEFGSVVCIYILTQTNAYIVPSGAINDP
jgi:hypothetical protein